MTEIAKLWEKQFERILSTIENFLTRIESNRVSNWRHDYQHAISILTIYSDKLNVENERQSSHSKLYTWKLYEHWKNHRNIEISRRDEWFSSASYLFHIQSKMFHQYLTKKCLWKFFTIISLKKLKDYFKHFLVISRHDVEKLS